MGFFDSIKEGFSNFYDHAILGKKTVEVKNSGTVEAAKVNSNAQIEAARLESETKIKIAEMEQESKRKLAEMEQEHKAELAGMEKERLEEWRAARLDIIQAQALAQIAIDKARLEGLTTVANQFVALQKTMLDMATKQIAIIEMGSLPIIKNIEKHYDEINDRISENRDEYNKSVLPGLLALLEQFEAGTPAHTLYMQQIQNDMSQQNHFIITQIELVKEQQNSVLKSFLESKKITLEQLEQRMQQIAAEVTASLPQSQASVQALRGANTNALP